MKKTKLFDSFKQKRILLVFLVDILFFSIVGGLIFGFLKILTNLLKNNLPNFQELANITKPELIERNLVLINSMKTQMLIYFILLILIIMIVYAISNYIIWKVISRKKTKAWHFLAASFSGIKTFSIIEIILALIFKTEFFLVISFFLVLGYLHFITCTNIIFSTSKKKFFQKTKKSFQLAKKIRLFIKPYGIALLILIILTLSFQLLQFSIRQIIPVNQYYSYYIAGTFFCLLLIYTAWLRIYIFNKVR